MFNIMQKFKKSFLEAAIEETVDMLISGKLEVTTPRDWIVKVEAATTVTEVWSIIKAATDEHKANGGDTII